MFFQVEALSAQRYTAAALRKLRAKRQGAIPEDADPCCFEVSALELAE